MSPDYQPRGSPTSLLLTCLRHFWGVCEPPQGWWLQKSGGLGSHPPCSPQLATSCPVSDHSGNLWSQFLTAQLKLRGEAVSLSLPQGGALIRARRALHLLGSHLGPVTRFCTAVPFLWWALPPVTWPKPFLFTRSLWFPVMYLPICHLRANVLTLIRPSEPWYVTSLLGLWVPWVHSQPCSGQSAHILQRADLCPHHTPGPSSRDTLQCSVLALCPVGIPRPSGFSETCTGGFVTVHGLLATSYHFGAIIRALLSEILLGRLGKEVAVKVNCLHVIGDLIRPWSWPLSAKTLRTSGSGRLPCTPSLWVAPPTEMPGMLNATAFLSPVLALRSLSEFVFSFTAYT